MTPPSLTIQTDQGSLSLPAGSTLEDAIEHLLQGRQQQASTVATAVNGEFVGRDERSRYALKDGDTVLCFAPITGG
jgi:sulfur carrier protein